MTQPKRLYANSDSFVFGMEAIEDDSRHPDNKKYSFANHIATAFDLDYTNNAYNAATNEFIFRRTIIDLEEFLKTSRAEDIFVLVGWTSLFRKEIVAQPLFQHLLKQQNTISVNPDDQEYHDFGTFFINPNQSHDIVVHKNNYTKHINLSDQITEFCAMYFWEDQLQIQQLSALVIALHNYLKMKGFKHLFVNCCLSTNQSIDFGIDPTVCFDWEESFYSWGTKKYPHLIRQKNHFHHQVHREYADILIQSINEKKLMV